MTLDRSFDLAAEGVASPLLRRARPGEEQAWGRWIVNVLT